MDDFHEHWKCNGKWLLKWMLRDVLSLIRFFIDLITIQKVADSWCVSSKVESTKRSVPLSDAAQRRERETAWMLSNVLISSLYNSFIINIYRQYEWKFVVVSLCLSERGWVEGDKAVKSCRGSSWQENYAWRRTFFLIIHVWIKYTFEYKIRRPIYINNYIVKFRVIWTLSFVKNWEQYNQVHICFLIWIIK